MLPFNQWKTWDHRIRHFTPAWYTIIMGTGVVSALLQNFPYGSGTLSLQIIALVFYLLNLVLFVCVSICTALRYILYPEIWSMMLTHPAQSLFIGCLPMGAATLINSGVALHQEWSFGGNGFLWTLWIFWWVDSITSFAVAFGMVYTMMVKQNHALTEMTPVWLLPVVTLIVASSTGGLLSGALLPHSETLALLTNVFSFTMAVIGLSLALMIITIYLSRLIIHGPPNPGLVLSSFITLGPLGQGGFSLLVNGQALSKLLPLHITGDFPQSALAGQMIFAGCFCGAFVLWSMGIAWALMACLSVIHVRRSVKLPFNMAYWGVIFPNGVFALLSVQLGKVLESPFFHAFGAAWSCIVFALWLGIFVRSIPAFIDGTLFRAPCLPLDTSPQPLFDAEKTIVVGSMQVTEPNSSCMP